MSHYKRRYFNVDSSQCVEHFTGGPTRSPDNILPFPLGDLTDKMRQTGSNLVDQVISQIPVADQQKLSLGKVSESNDPGRYIGPAEFARQKTERKYTLDWGYDCSSETLHCPKNWGNAKTVTENQCARPGKQSPIDLNWRDNFPNLKMFYNTDNNKGKIVNLGPVIRIECVGDNTITLNGEEYALKFIDLHSPSDHTYKGRNFDAELQLVHFPVKTKSPTKSKYQYAVVSVLLNSERPESTLPSIWDEINGGQTLLLPRDKKPTVSQQNTLNLRALSDNVIGHNATQMFHYTGSLTVPPCTRNVKWILAVPPYHCLQFDQNLRSIIGNNNRPIQPR